ncbi:hypothetical protein CYMTET_30701 [Cymbomonas tetramitiformis]|uniref:Arginine decarboxylase n=1 Tax=Cymbomonas tetramitiformis TaxID=36881 RepID=A0AAE0KTN3_9CHLO|nr:hypothetical protein CYMTET_30701 [Cymbomonas tetramitiformis]
MRHVLHRVNGEEDRAYAGGNVQGSSSSANYTVQNYANDVVAAVQDVCIQKGVPPPILVSESGRALASHQSVLCFDVRAVSSGSADDEDAMDVLSSPVFQAVLPEEPEVGDSSTAGAGAYMLKTFREVYTTMGAHNYREAYNDSLHFQGEARSLFRLGVLSLHQAAAADELLTAVRRRALCEASAALKGTDDYSSLPEELAAAARASTSLYHINLSIFRSCPDTWAIGQVFPVMPLHRLDEPPTVRARLADLTCDSDGQVDQFILSPHARWNNVDGSRGPVSDTLLLHDTQPVPCSVESSAAECSSGGAALVAPQHEQYVLGLFLAGAYQEVMGNSHNLFGSTSLVHIWTAANKPNPRARSSYLGGSSAASPRHRVMIEVTPGQTTEEVMRSGTPTKYSRETMMEELRADALKAVTLAQLAPEEAQKLIDNFERAFDSYTYLAQQ